MRVAKVRTPGADEAGTATSLSSRSITRASGLSSNKAKNLTTPHVTCGDNMSIVTHPDKPRQKPLRGRKIGYLRAQPG